MKTVLRLFRLQFLNWRLWTDNQFEVGNYLDNQLRVIAQILEKGFPPAGELCFRSRQ